MAQFETNLFGVIRVMRAVIPLMRKQRSGTIANVSSVVGKIAVPLFAAYVSSKFALEGLSESMRYELEQFGVNVILIEPGVIKTNFGINLKIAKNAARQDSSYSQIMRKIITFYESALENATAPVEVANVILGTITSNNPEPRYLVGNDAYSFMDSRKNNSDRDFEKIMVKNLLR